MIPLFSLPIILGDIGIWLATPIAELLCLGVSIPLMIKSLKKLTLI